MLRCRRLHLVVPSASRLITSEEFAGYLGVALTNSSNPCITTDNVSHLFSGHALVIRNFVQSTKDPKQPVRLQIIRKEAKWGP